MRPFLQQARHQSVLATGLLLLPMSLVVGIGSLASGRLTARFGPLPPIMAGLTLGAAGPEHAGVAGGILNAARQSGGALGVALLGSLLGSGRDGQREVQAQRAAGGYLVALALAALTIRGRS